MSHNPFEFETTGYYARLLAQRLAEEAEKHHGYDQMIGDVPAEYDYKYFKLNTPTINSLEVESGYMVALRKKRTC